MFVRVELESKWRKEGVTYIACNIEHSFFVTRLIQRVYNRAKKGNFFVLSVFNSKKETVLGGKGKKGLVYIQCAIKASKSLGLGIEPSTGRRKRVAIKV